MTSKSEIQSIDNNWFGDNGGVNIIQGSINGIVVRQSVSRGHLGTREDLPDDVKALEEEGPASLASRQFTRVFDVEEVFVVSDDGDGV